jgi:hypothetical protein
VLLRIAEAAALLSISRTELYQLVGQGGRPGGADRDPSGRAAIGGR